MIELKTLTFNNIRCFNKKQTIDFSNRDKLIQVDGRNENTGGSSGAGKTTVFLALDYLLGISDIPSTVLQSRLTKKTIEVSGEFVVGDKPVSISRSKKGGLTIKTPDETISGNVKLAEEKLDEILGIPRKLFKKMVHKKQKEGGFFLNLTAKEMYEFLINMLGLQKYTDQVDKISEDIKAKTKREEELAVETKLSSKEIKDLELLLKELKEPIITTSEDEVKPLEERLEKYKESLDRLEKEKAAKLSELQEPKRDVVYTKEQEEKAVRLSEAIHKVDMELSSAKYDERDLPKFIEQYKKMAEEKKKMLDHRCPTCDQHWEAHQDLLAGKAKLMTELQMKIVKAKQAAEGIPALQAKYDKLKEMKAKLEVEIKTIESTIENEYLNKLNDYKTKVSEVEKLYSERINTRKDSIRNTSLDLSQKITKINSEKEALSSYKENKEKMLKLLETKSKDLDQKIEEYNKIIWEKNIAEEAKRLIKSYTLQTFQDTLDIIGDTATATLGGIPNMSTSSVYFEGCKETKSGKIKDEVSAILTMDGEDKIPIKSLSGGERTAIDLAVDLALIDVIESKAGKGANFYVIDEPFDGLDSVCKENCLEILRQIDTNKMIIMVDHSSELKEMVSDIITVVKSGESSTVI